MIGDVAVCVDDVERAGLFLEMEKLVGAGSAVLEVQAELDGLARSLGVPMQRVSDTYDSLIRAGASVGLETSHFPRGSRVASAGEQHKGRRGPL